MKQPAGFVPVGGCRVTSNGVRVRNLPAAAAYHPALACMLLTLFCLFMLPCASHSQQRATATVPLMLEPYPSINAELASPARDGQAAASLTPKLLVDTGSAFCIITDELAARLHLEVQPALSDNMPLKLNGIAVQAAIVPTVSIGTVSWHDIAFLVLTAGIFKQLVIGVNAEGILGGDLLSQTALQFDLERKELTLYQGGKLTGEELAKCGTNPARAVSLYSPQPIKLALPIRLNGRVDRIVTLDTGSMYTLLDAATAKALGMKAISSHVAIRVSGVDTHYNAGMLDSLAVGDAVFRDVSCGWYESASSSLPPTLGIDLLANRHFIIDYPALKFYLLPQRVNPNAVDPTVRSRTISRQVYSFKLQLIHNQIPALDATLENDMDKQLPSSRVDTRLIIGTSEPYNMITRDLADKLHLSLIPTTGPDKRPLKTYGSEIYAADVPRLSIGVGEVQNVTFLVMPTGAFQSVYGQGAGGVLSAGSLYGCAIVIDTAQRLFTMIPDGKLSPSDLAALGFAGSTPVRMSVDAGQRPKITVQLGEKTSHELVLATEYSTFLNRQDAKALVFRSNSAPQNEMRFMGRHPYLTGTLSRLACGNVEFKNLAVKWYSSATDQPEADLGIDVLSRHAFIVDWPGQRFYIAR